MTFGNYSLHNSNKYLHPAFTSEKVEAGFLTKPIETVQKTIETGVDTFVGQEKDLKKKKSVSILGFPVRMQVLGIKFLPVNL